MSEEIKNLIENSKHPEALASLFDRAADQLDEIVAERRRESAERRKADEGCTDEQ